METELKTTLDPAQRSNVPQDLEATRIAKPKAKTATTGDSPQASFTTGPKKQGLKDWKKLTKELSVQEWITLVTVQNTLRNRSKLVSFLLWSYGFLIVTSTVIFFLQGFHYHGFNLNAGLLNSLGQMTVGEIGGLLMLTFRFTFSRGSGK